MATESPRLQRLLADELGECCDADVGDRVDELRELSETLPNDQETDLAVLSTLSDDTRNRLARYLVAAGGELCVCELSVLVDISDSAVSHALSDLHDAGLVTRRSEGQWRYYDATERTERLLTALDGTRDGEDGAGNIGEGER